ncbi:serine/threonine specific protein phosphatase [Paucilactobacillus hokkaidonensis JCM 18461]|uniref:protein-serine/threonine phosphatase n=2 Tax=Paucilactobacillus hokkaidonensis TaxID=1193095 RepID=A0A0A1GTG0_9LACO|nr:Stp1/IreP family PP2C-type Ser/Thr phosphatase [Paucilactobacillus hokkaidonensis]KRO09762.1 serine threonine specific protein phosphatase [Paucilactobacillus hokkaidonensis]BAP85572.1 serine/threonine specific protein phosphatase [Paucilactobacillus hokkaidonensis JCM 18461]
MEIAYQTDIGQEREDNQDYVGVFTNQDQLTFAIVADGIGGHQGGDVASSMAVSHIGYHFEQTTFKNPMDAVRWLSDQVRIENEKIIDKSNQFKDLNGMGTTMVAAIFFDDQMVVANIGDSRGYLRRNGELNQLTEDHSLVNELVKRGVITEQEAKTHPQKNIITRTLGISPDADIDINLYQLESSDQLLLCTDGLSNMVSNQQLDDVLKSDQTLAEKCQQLIKMANETGGPDNITVLIADNAQEVDDK